MNVPVQVGDKFTTAQLSPCVGGLMRTWTDSELGRLWSVDDAAHLLSIQGSGKISRTLQADGRFREAAAVSEATNTMLLQSRFPTQATESSVQLEGNILNLRPARSPWPPPEVIYQDMLTLLKQAVWHCVTNNEFLLVERGGWDASPTPFCMQILFSDGEELLSCVQTSPPPQGSDIWRPHIVRGEPVVSLSAPANEDTIGVAPLLMMEAIAEWGLEPWDLALTFCSRTAGA